MTITASRLEVRVSKASAKRSETGAMPKAAPAVEVDLTDATGHQLGWRSKTAESIPLSLSIPVVPTVLDVFTSPKGDVSDRRRVFFLGESMQWNVVHRVAPLVKVPYDVTVHLQRIGLGSVSDKAARLETVFPIETSLSSRFKYQFRATRNSWSWDAVPPFNTVITGAADQIVQGIAKGEFGLIAHPGLWRMSAVVTIPSRVRRAYHLRSFAWDYEIVGERRADS